jgi:hypothetical protein
MITTAPTRQGFFDILAVGVGVKHERLRIIAIDPTILSGQLNVAEGEE